MPCLIELPKTQPQIFTEHLEKHSLIGFGGYKIKTYLDDDGILKKILGTGRWKHINSKNYKTHIGKDNYGNDHSSFYIITGKDAGYIGIDFDTQVAYDAFITHNPECAKFFTQKTKKGFHILFKYDKRFSHSCSNDAHEKDEFKIDFRSDGGMLVSYPTKYKHHETNEIYSYDIHIDGELGTITDKIVKYFDDNGVVYYKLKNDTKTRVNKKKEEIKKTIEDKIEEVQDELDEISSQSGKVFIRMCECFDKQRVANYNSWFEMGCMLKNHFINKKNEKEGKDCFKHFSQLKDENGEMFYPNYDLETLLEKWNTMEVFKVKKVDKNKSWDKIKKWAKKDNAEKFNAIFDINDLNLTSSYSDLKTAFEETNFKVRNPVSFCEVVDIDGQEELVWRTPAETNTLYENLFWTKYEYIPPKDEDEGEGTWKTEEREFIKDWRKDTELLEYERVDFRPYCLEDTTPDNIYNQFRGFNAMNYYLDWLKMGNNRREAEDNDEGIGILLQHIKDLCGCPEFYEYFLDMLAFKIQFPARKNNIACIFKSLQGAGKDSFFDWFGNEMLGSKYYLNIQGLNQLENFNALLSCKLLVVLNEFEIKESISNKEKFKSLITNVVNVINEKNEKMRKEKDYTNYVLLTNNTISFSVESGDRRLTATEANNAICNNKEYFDEKYEYIYGKDKYGEYVGKSFIAPFFQFLLNRNVEKKDWINTRVKTKYYNTLQEYSIPPLVRFFEYLNNQYFHYGAGYNGRCSTITDTKHSVFSAGEFYDCFKRFRSDWNYKSADWNNTLFGTHLRTYIWDGDNALDGEIPYKFIIKKRSKVICYVLDSIKMIEFLEKEGIISNNNGECLITSHLEDGNDSDSD
jgi:hypothetical protein